MGAGENGGKCPMLTEEQTEGLKVRNLGIKKKKDLFAWTSGSEAGGRIRVL